MRPLALLLALVCGTAAAGEPARDRGPVRSAVVLFPTGPATVEGGVWLSDKAAVATGEEIVRLRNQNTLLVVGLVLAGVVAAGAAGWALRSTLAPPAR